MEKNGQMSKYELVIILDSKLTSDEKESIYKDVMDTVGKSGGKVINGQVWLDKQRFSFPIHRRIEGTYYLINYEAVTSANEKIRSVLRINERVLRFLMIKGEQQLVAKN